MTQQLTRFTHNSFGNSAENKTNETSGLYEHVTRDRHVGKFREQEISLFVFFLTSIFSEFSLLS